MGQSASLALARKWRPRDFSSLVGQEHVVQALSHSLNLNRLHHAYLLTGTRGVGKTTIARIFAKALNCQQGLSAKPCGQCQACQEIAEGRFADLIEVDAATNTRVDEMRQLLDNAVYMPTSGRYKVYVIDEVHMLSTSSFNAMLKTLEEPPEHVVFILATTDPQKIPATVLSRCLQFSLRQLGVDQLFEHLAGILKSEGVVFEPGALRLIAKAARGSVRDALSITDQAIAYGANTLTESGVRQMLGFVDENVTIAILQGLASQSGEQLMQLATRLSQKNVSFVHVFDEFASACFYLSMQSVAGCLRSDDPDHAALFEFSEQFSGEDLQLFYQVAIHARDELHLAPQPHIGFGMALIRLLCFRPSTSLQLVQAVLAPASKNFSDNQQSVKKNQVQGLSSISTNTAATQTIQHSDSAKALKGLDAAMLAVDQVIANRNQDPRYTKTESSRTPSQMQQSQAAESQSGNFQSDSQLNSFNHAAGQQLNAATWPDFAASLSATGLIRQVLVQSEFVAWKEQPGQPLVCLVLRIATKSLSDVGVVDKLELMLSNQFGRPIQIQFEQGSVQHTASLQAQSARRQSQEHALKSIANDPLVQQLQHEMGATVIEGSIRSLSTNSPADL